MQTPHRDSLQESSCCEGIVITTTPELYPVNLVRKLQKYSSWIIYTLNGIRGLFPKNSNSDLNQVTDSVTSYLTFCADSVIPSKQVRLYPNNKPWVTKDLKICLNKTKLAFLSGDRQKVNELEKEFRQKSRLARIHNKNKVEQQFTTGNAREAWQGLNTIMGKKQKPAQIKCPEPTTLVEQLNNLYGRYDNSQQSLRDWTPSGPCGHSPPKQRKTGQSTSCPE